MRPTKADLRAYEIASFQGCKPQWANGMLGWGFHCTCDDNRHGCDQQCSTIVYNDGAGK